MNSYIILERSVPVRCWRVVGQVAKAEKRPELIPVLLRARETGGTDARDLAGHLLFEPQSRRVVGERLLHIAHGYGLIETEGSNRLFALTEAGETAIDTEELLVPEHEAWNIRENDYPLRFFPLRVDPRKGTIAYEEINGAEERDGVFALTEAGETAIDTEEVLVPERGTWSIWTSDDPLLPRILRIEPWKEPSARKEIFDKVSARRQVALPDWLRDVAGTPIKPAAQGTAVRIDELEGQAAAVDGRLRLRWNVGEGRLQLTGTLEGKKVATELEPPSISLNQIWRTLLKEEVLLDRWDVDREILHVTFDETNETERQAMSRDLEFDSPIIPGYGEFETLTVRGVPITPVTESDAQSWANWRLQLRIRDYATSERYAAWRVEAAEPFDQYDVELPTRSELFDEFWNPTANRPEPEAWRLAAAEDWNL